MIIGRLVAMLGADVTGLKRGMREGSKAVKRHSTAMRGQLNQTRKSIISMQSAFMGMAALFAANRVAGSFIEVAAGFEKMEVKLDALTKGSGVETLEKINEWAIRMPVNTRQAVDAFTLMTGMGLEPTIKTMQTLVDVSSIFGDDVLGRIALQMGQMGAKGRVMAQDLNIMAEAGINARQYLKDAFGMTVEEVQKSGKDISEVIAAIWAGMDQEFGGSAIKMMESWSGIVVTFKSAIIEIQRAIMGAGVFDALKEKLVKLTDATFAWLENNRELIDLKVPEYVEKVEAAFSKMYDILTYDKDIIKWGLVGLLIGGKKGAVMMGGLAHLGNVIMVQAHAFKLWREGLLNFKDIAGANYNELKKLVEGVGTFKNEMTEAHGTVNQMGDALQADHMDVSKSTEIYEALTDVLGGVDGAYQKLIIKEKRLADKRAKERSKEGEKTMGIRLDSFFGDVDAYEGALDKIADLTDEKIGRDFWQIKAEERYQVQERGLQALLDAEVSFSDSMIKLTERTAWSMQRNFSDFFFDVMQGNLNDLSDYVNAFLDSIQKSLSDYLGQMFTEGLVGMIPKAGGGGGIFNWIGSGLGKVFGGGGSGNGVMAGGAGSVNYGFGGGGHIGETVQGVGIQSGKSYEFHGNETVIPDAALGGGKVEVIINNNTESEATVSQGTGASGMSQVIVDIGANDVMSGGNLARAFETTYNVKRRGRF